jgi:hypothetical protein
MQIYVPSFIFREDEQRAMIEEHQLCIQEIIHSGIEVASPPISPKLTMLGRGCSLATGYVVEKLTDE